MARVDIIVPIYNGAAYFEPCLRSVLRWTSPEMARIVAADDASTPESRQVLAALQAANPRLEVLWAERNQGFLRNCNHAIRATSGEFVLLLNSDTLATPGWLERMLRAAATDERIGLVNALTSSGFEWCVPVIAGGNVLTMAEAVAAHGPGTPLDVVPTFGHCLMIRRKPLEALGLLDEAYGRGWYEDLDLFMRFVSQGWRGVAACDAYIFHRGEASFDRRKDQEELERNRLLFNGRWGARFDPLLEAFRKRRMDAVARLFAEYRTPTRAALRKHLPLLFAGHPRRMLFYLGIERRFPSYERKDLSRAALERFRLRDAPRLVLVLRDAEDAPNVRAILRLTNALVLRGVDCVVVSWRRVVPAATRDSYAAPACYSSRAGLLASLPRFDVACVPRPNLSAERVRALAERIEPLAAPMTREELVTALTSVEADMAVCRDVAQLEKTLEA
jgi:GT2 family glycosyltransferase